MPFQPDIPYASENLITTLFNNIMVDDDIDLNATYPYQANTACNQEELEECYRITWQLLARRSRLQEFRRILIKIALRRKALFEEQEFYKEIRAQFKHMRFGCSNFDRRHIYPWQLHFITCQMGFLQDAFRNGQRFKTFRKALLLWGVLHPLLFRQTLKRLAAFKPATPENFKNFQKNELKKIIDVLNFDQKVTGHQFHSLRKIISRRTAYVDTLRVIRPNKELDALSIFLATINGLMGDMHDELIFSHITGDSNYNKEQFSLPDIINVRLKALIEAEQLSENL